MAKLENSDLFLVGSVPVASDKPEDAMRLCGRVLGDHLFALPDGEVGERRMWIGGLGATTFSKHPDLEKAPEAGPFGAYRFKPGVTSISFKGYLPYSDAAISSYQRRAGGYGAGWGYGGWGLGLGVLAAGAVIGSALAGPSYGYAPGYNYGYAPAYNYGHAPAYNYGYAPGYNYGYSRAYYGYAPTYNYGYRRAYYGYAPSYNYGYARPYNYGYRRAYYGYPPGLYAYAPGY